MLLRRGIALWALGEVREAGRFFCLALTAREQLDVREEEVRRSVLEPIRCDCTRESAGASYRLRIRGRKQESFG